jgi:RimJ/RimL family protein N-acetyltransferase
MAGRPSQARAGPYHQRVDVTFDRLHTRRLVLRRFTAEDADSLTRYRSIPEVARFQGWDAPFALERAQAMVTSLVAHEPDEPGEWYQLAIALRDDPGRLVGDCGFRPRTDEPLVVDIGFTLDPSVQGRGLATEAVGELIRYLFEDRGKHKVCADCDTRNAASWRLMERLGLTREGTLRKSYRDGHGWADEYLYGLLVADWPAVRDITRSTHRRSPEAGDATPR